MLPHDPMATVLPANHAREVGSTNGSGISSAVAGKGI
jgi:hypothetical protein